MGRSVTASLVLALGMALGGCTLAYRPAHMPRTVGEDTVGYSIAYARAANNQILLNILQARDRLPMHYLSVSGIADAPTASNTVGASLLPLPLGNPAGALSGSSAAGTSSLTVHPSYGVTPLDPERLLKAVYSPAPNEVFQYYWENGWPRDVLLYLLVKEAHAGSCANLTAQEVIHAGAVTVASGGPGARDCAYVQAHGPADITEVVAKVRANRAAHRPMEVTPFRRGGCTQVSTASDTAGRLELLKLAAANKAYSYSEDAKTGVGRLESCGGERSIALVFAGEDGHAQLYRIELRSLEQMTYWLGGRVREGGMPMVRPPGSEADGHDVPLFRVEQGPPPQGVSDEDFAAALTYRGQRYRAGFAADCELATTCSERARAVVDRSGTVLALLAQLYALAPAPESLTPPTRFVVD